jgi:serine phosphatase RsbU (regulator of sigma subunit)
MSVHMMVTVPVGACSTGERYTSRHADESESGAREPVRRDGPLIGHHFPVSERRKGWVPSATSVVVLVVGLVLSVLLAFAASRAHADNEHRLLVQRTREAAAALEAALPSIEAPLSTTAALPQITNEGDAAVLRRALGSQVGPTARFVSASVWPVAGGEPAEVVGDRPELADQPAGQVRAFLRRAVSNGRLTIYSLLEGGQPRLGYAVPSPEGGARYLVYAEQALPPDRTAAVQRGQAFEGLQYALYLGPRETRDDLVFASTADLPLEGRMAVETIPFGDTTFRLVMSPSGDLGGTLLARLAYLTFGAGLIATLAGAALIERLQRRRRDADRLAEENARLYAEQRARSLQLQESLLPLALPHLDGVEMAVRYRAGVAGTAVGGDWYDVIDVGQSLVVVVGDVSGRGLAAASSMAAVRHTVRTLAAQGLEAHDILEKANRFMEPQREGQFATVICGVADRSTRTVTFASAGHPRPIMVHEGTATWVDVPVGPPLGAAPSPTYQATPSGLPRGAMLLLVTDGLFERRGETIDAGLERLRRTAAEVDGTPEEVIDRIVDLLEHGTSSDDTAIIALRWN